MNLQQMPDEGKYVIAETRQLCVGCRGKKQKQVGLQNLTFHCMPFKDPLVGWLNGGGGQKNQLNRTSRITSY